MNIKISIYSGSLREWVLEKIDGFIKYQKYLENQKKKKNKILNKQVAATKKISAKNQLDKFIKKISNNKIIKKGFKNYAISFFVMIIFLALPFPSLFQWGSILWNSFCMVYFLYLLFTK